MSQSKQQRAIFRYLAMLSLVVCPSWVWAQSTNIEVYQNLAVGCLGSVPESTAAFQLDGAAHMAYLRPVLVQHWQAQGQQVYLPDSSRSEPLPRLQYRIEEAQVRYERAPDKQVERQVVLALHHTLIAADGRLLKEDRCRDTHTDLLDRSAVEQVQSAAFPEARADLPTEGGIRRYLEPAVLAGAVTAIVYLFFNVRS